LRYTRTARPRTPQLSLRRDEDDKKTHGGLWTSEVVRNSPNSKNGEGICSTDLDASRTEEVESKGEGKEEEKKK
jgi:hypothetical protein